MEKQNFRVLKEDQVSIVGEDYLKGVSNLENLDYAREFNNGNYLVASYLDGSKNSYCLKNGMWTNEISRLSAEQPV